MSRSLVITPALPPADAFMRQLLHVQEDAPRIPLARAARARAYRVGPCSATRQALLTQAASPRFIDLRI